LSGEKTTLSFFSDSRLGGWGVLSLLKLPFSLVSFSALYSCVTKFNFLAATEGRAKRLFFLIVRLAAAFKMLRNFCSFISRRIILSFDVECKTHGPLLIRMGETIRKGSKEYLKSKKICIL